jgi:hypothetical protein
MMSKTVDLFTALLTAYRLRLELQSVGLQIDHAVKTQFVLAREQLNFVNILPHWTLTPQTGRSLIIIGHRSLAFTLTMEVDGHGDVLYRTTGSCMMYITSCTADSGGEE